MKPSPPRSSHSALRHGSIVWLLVGSFVLTIASFVSATVIATLRARGVETAAKSITTNALPSVACLSSARTELRQIELLLERLTNRDGRAPRRIIETDRNALRQSRYALEQQWTRCIDYPTYDGERALQEEIAERSAEMYASVDRVLACVDRGDQVGALDELKRHTEPAVDKLDAVMVNNIDLNARHSAELGAEISHLTSSSRQLRSFLMTMSALLAVAAAFFMVRVLRRFTALMESRVSDMESFAGRVAHDIRSPLASVGLALELTKRDPTRGVARGVLDRASATLQRMGELVDGLLVFALSGESPDESASTNASDVISAVIDDMRSTADEAGIALDIEELDRSLVVACSSGVLMSLVSNLVGNAIKHMGSAPVRRISARTHDRGRTVRVEIADSGPGVPASLKEHIFDPYVRSAGSSGIGLGLATVRRLAEAHGGAVGVTSIDDGRGSVFWFELPKATERRRAGQLSTSGVTPPTPTSG